MLAGVCTQVLSNFDIRVHWGGIYIEADIDFSAMADLGFKLPKEGEYKGISFEQTVPIYAMPTFKMFGFIFELGIYGFRFLT